MIKKNICIFGYLDSEAGQLYNLLDLETKNKIKFFVCFDKLPKVNIKIEHKKRPNRKTTFCKNGKLFGIKVLDYPFYLNQIKKNEIEECYITESNIKKRKLIYQFAKKNKLKINKFIHSSVVFADKKNTNIGEGTIIYPRNYIGYKTDIGKCCIIQSNCNLEHHNKIDKFCNLNPGVQTGGFTKIGMGSEIHLGSKIINRIKIGNNCRVGAGSLVLKDLPPNTLAYGHPAKKIKKN